MFVLHKYPLSIDGGTILAYPTEIVFNTDLELVKLAYIVLYLGEVQRLYNWGYLIGGKNKVAQSLHSGGEYLILAIRALIILTLTPY